MSVNRWRLLRQLDWPRFLRAFFLVDVANLVVPLWELARRSTGAPGSSDALEEVREVSMAARFELDQLVEEAGRRAG